MARTSFGHMFDKFGENSNFSEILRKERSFRQALHQNKVNTSRLNRISLLYRKRLGENSVTQNLTIKFFKIV